MCVVSAIIDNQINNWPKIGPTVTPGFVIHKIPCSQEELDEFRELLKKAKEWDKRTNQPNCESLEKTAKLKELCKELGEIAEATEKDLTHYE